MLGHTGANSGLQAVGEVFNTADSIGTGEIQNRLRIKGHLHNARPVVEKGCLYMQSVRFHGAVTAGAAVVALAVSLAACSSSSSSSGGSSSSLSGTLNASGSTFQLPYQQAAIQAYKSIRPGITVNYGGGGSGKGRSDLASGVVNFAGSDSPIPSDEVANFKGKTVLYFPVLLGPITMSYNLSGVSNLKLDPTVIADIFQAKIKTWNDPAIKALNPGVSLPSTPISLAVRSDSSGTTANFSLFLQTAAGNDWKLGSSSTINWPSSAHAGNGNGGVAQIVKTTPGAIGYVDYADAKAAGLTYASVKNAAGSYIAPSPASASAAGTTTTVAPDLTFHAVWSPNPQAYPITYQSWDLVYQKQSSATTTKLLKAYIGYLIGDGQKLLTSLGYAPLPSNIDAKAKAQLSKIGS
jgi:phosphate transport system substrate-binding protein